MSAKFAQVIISLNTPEVDSIYDYRIPEHLSERSKTGMRCIVPFGRSNINREGYIVAIIDETMYAERQIKELKALLDDFPMFSEQMITLAWWMKEKYYTTFSQCLRCIMPAGIKKQTSASSLVKYARYAMLTGRSPEGLTDKQLRVFRYLESVDAPVPVTMLKSDLKITDSPIKTMEQKGIIKIEKLPIDRNFTPQSVSAGAAGSDICLTAEQRSVIDRIYGLMLKNKFKSVLLHGVTGSGKTEVYIRLIRKALDMGRQAIVLVPEISLTPQTVTRLLDRFGDDVALTHSRMSVGERYEQWQRALKGTARIMIGPRSAVFAPFDNLGLIIIDEEHENSYKSEVTPKYDALEVAEMRCVISSAIMVLGTATPSIRSYYRATIGEHELLTLKQRIGNAILPDVTLVDMRNELTLGNMSIFSAQLRDAITENISTGEQTILFLNRRGHSTFVSCRKCGYAMKCNNCSITYTYHKSINKLTCHYCGHEEANPSTCPQCGSKYIKYFGVGTQKVEEELTKLFPTARVLRMDMDTTTTKNSHEQILKQFGSGKADILIGTQMIAKGHDFPRVTLVGIVSADMSMNTGDFRASETTYQLITQVSGRAGRGKLPGKVFVQTYNPDQYSIVHAKNQCYEQFYNEEITLRRQLMYPPFSHIFTILMVSEDEKRMIVNAFKFSEILRDMADADMDVMGPMPAMLSKIKNQYRWKIIIKCSDENLLRNKVLAGALKFKSEYTISDIAINLTMDTRVLL